MTSYINGAYLRVRHVWYGGRHYERCAFRWGSNVKPWTCVRNDGPDGTYRTIASNV